MPTTPSRTKSSGSAGPSTYTPAADAEVVWRPIPNKIGDEFGATYGGHLVDVAELDGRWYWSAVHAWGCVPRGRGASGVEASRKAAEQAALDMVNTWPCAGSIRIASAT